MRMRAVRMISADIHECIYMAASPTLATSSARRPPVQEVFFGSVVAELTTKASLHVRHPDCRTGAHALA